MTTLNELINRLNDIVDTDFTDFADFIEYDDVMPFITDPNGCDDHLHNAIEKAIMENSVSDGHDIEELYDACVSEADLADLGDYCDMNC